MQVVDLFFITIIIYIFITIDFMNQNNKLDYGYTLTLVGIIYQIIYFVLSNIKLKDKKVFVSKEIKKNVEEEVDSEII